MRPIALLFLLGLALGQSAPLEAVLVLRENVLEEGRLVAYTGTKRYPVASEAELLRLLDRLARPPRPPGSSTRTGGGGGWRRRASPLTGRRP